MKVLIHSGQRWHYVSAVVLLIFAFLPLDSLRESHPHTCILYFTKTVKKNKKKLYKIIKHQELKVVYWYVSVCVCVPQWYCGQQSPGTWVWTRDSPAAQLTDDSGHRLTSHTAKHCNFGFEHTERKGKSRRVVLFWVFFFFSFSNTKTHHSSTVDSSCWWCSDPLREFLHESKREWARYMTHTLFGQKKCEII